MSGGWGLFVVVLAAGCGFLVARLLELRAQRHQQLELTTVRSLYERVKAERDALADAERNGSQHLARSVRAETELVLARQRIEALEEGQRNEVEQARRLASAEMALEGERLRSMEREREFERSRESTRKEMKLLGQRLIEEQGQAMLDESQRSIEAMLEPVKERLKDFEARLQHSSEQDGRDRAALLERLRALGEAQTRLHADAEALARALTGEARAQGEWGELILESLLSTAGLTEGREYELQVDHLDAEGRRKRPDALIYLPGERVIVVDAKCPLQAFIASTRSSDDGEREVDLTAHVGAVRSHVRQLAAKDYQAVVHGRSLDIVLLFLPNEAAFHAAISRDPALYEDAFRQRVVLCSPTTLLATLQVVRHVWRSERQTLNAQRIADEAGKMIDKISGALEAFDELGDRLTRAHAAYDQARSRLSTGRNSVSQIASRVVDLGAAQSRPARLEAVQQRLGIAGEEAELPDAHEKGGDW